MKKYPFISLFSQLGDYLRQYLAGEAGDSLLDRAIMDSYENNPLFTPFFQRYSISAIEECFLDEWELRRWINDYEHLRCGDGSFGLKDKVVEIVMAGNIPMVGFHDLLVAMASGAKVRIKLSSKDPFLIPCVLKIMAGFEGGEEIGERVTFVDREFYESDVCKPDALLFMGADSSSVFFENLYPSVPKLARKSRTSIGLIYRDISDRDLKSVAEAILIYYGMGCRSVGHLKVERGFDMERIARALEESAYMTDNGYMSNIFRRNRALLSMEGRSFYSGGNMIVVEDENYLSDVGVVAYSFFEDDGGIERELARREDVIQKIYYNFGSCQRPPLREYPDGRDTLLFLLDLINN